MTLQNKTLGEVLFPLTSKYFPRLNRTDNPFELYRSQKGCGRAEAAITRKVEATLGWLLSQPRSIGSQTLLEQGMKKIDATLRKYRGFGAQDSEPYYHCEKILAAALEMD
jgi:hypothetical protein